MESNRYFILQVADGIWTVNVYEQAEQAAYDYIRMGGLLTPDTILAQESEVSLRLDNKTLEYSRKEDE